MSEVTEERKQLWRRQLNYLAANLSKLTEWELDFVQSVSRQFDYKDTMSIWQSSKLREIFQRRLG